MKKILSGTFLCAVTFFAVTSCDVMDFYPSDKFSPPTVWSTEQTTDIYATGFYAIFKDNAEPYNYNGEPLQTDAYTDLIKSNSWDQYNHPYNKALLQSTEFNSSNAGVFECWSTHYDRIRRQNEFLRDAHPFADKFGVDWVNVRIAEVRFCRAYTYWLLCRVYGSEEENLGVVIRTAVDGPEANDKSRATLEACWDLIISDLEAAAEDLPDDESYWGAAYAGRATKKSAYALLSRVALYAKRWDVAVKAADDAKTAGAALADNYADLFALNGATAATNAEVCFGVDFVAEAIGTNWDYRVRPPGDNPDRAPLAVFNPTSELADAYEMADGTPFDWNNPAHKANPYTGRDPRFYATILYNGVEWNGRTLWTYDLAPVDGFKTFTKSGAAGATVTGYYLKKYLRDGDMSYLDDDSSTSLFWNTIRYAEVLLNKAEALAEQDDIPGALDALNEVRERVDLPDATASDYDEFMEILRHERIVELASEGFRYWDLRRWRLAEDVINGQSCHGVKITRSGSASPYTYTYNQVDIDAGDKRIFTDNYYAFSIPQQERDNNKLFGENNPGW